MNTQDESTPGLVMFIRSGEWPRTRIHFDVLGAALCRQPGAKKFTTKRDEITCEKCRKMLIDGGYPFTRKRHGGKE